MGFDTIHCTYIPNFSNVAALGLFKLFTYNSREKEEGFVALKFKSNILYTMGHGREVGVGGGGGWVLHCNKTKGTSTIF